MTMGSALLRVSGLSVGYGAAPTVADFSFSLERGEILCIVGESGCGKSTLLKAIPGMTPGLRVLAGSILLAGEDLCALSPKQRRELCTRRIGFVFQNPGGAFNPIRSYRKQFIETLRSHGLYRSADFERQASEALEKLGLPEPGRVLSCCPYEMSGGMNQRVALALTLLLGQELLLADEPTSALDATIQLQVARELKRLRDQSGISQIIVTHNLALAEYLGDRIGVIYAGRLVELGPAKAVLSAPAHPYTESLMAAIPALDGIMPEGLPGQAPLSGPAEQGCEFADRCPQAAERCKSLRYNLRSVGEGHWTSCPGTEGGAP